jgi:hypothetical protein
LPGIESDLRPEPQRRAAGAQAFFGPTIATGPRCRRCTAGNPRAGPGYADPAHGVASAERSRPERCDRVRLLPTTMDGVVIAGNGAPLPCATPGSTEAWAVRLPTSSDFRVSQAETCWPAVQQAHRAGSERRLTPKSVGVVAGRDEELSSVIGADAQEHDERRRRLTHEHGDLLLERCRLIIELEVSPRY